MDTFWVVTLFHFQPMGPQWSQLELSANEHSTLGIEEFSLNEAEVDALLGERSYSGGDLPDEVLDEVENRVLSNPRNYRFFFSCGEDAQAFALICRELLAETQVEEFPQQDWNAEWKKHYKPISVNGNFEIIPSWMTDYIPNSANSILIYPGMGFGTGSHETTFLCLRLLTEDLSQAKMRNCLDFGSGSGILGLSALKLLPELKVDFYDIDPEANKNCYQNAILNKLEKSSFRLLLPEVRSKLEEDYDLVFANILESILLAEKENLIKYTCVGGHLLLSGLLKHQVNGVISAYEAMGMKVLKHLEKNDWAAVLLRRNH